MGYRIVYGRKERKRISPKKIGAIFAVMIVVAILMLPSSRAVVAEILLPGDPEVTASALQTLVSDLGEGQGIGDAVTAFCHEIIAGGQ